MNFLKAPKPTQINFNTPERFKKFHDADDQAISTSILGRGAYGTVFRATYKNKEVAVKILDKSNYVKYQSLRNEANVLNLQHENIIKLIKIVDCKTYGAVIMELFDGTCLQSVVDNYKIDLIHRLNMLTDIACALKFCHENSIVHSDLKPQNVLVAVNLKTNDDRNYVCKLFDFGCSMKLHDTNENVGGTVRYCAPEVLQSLESDCSADIFSLAIIMWQMKENRIPYGSLENETIIWNVVKNNMRPGSLKCKDDIVKKSHETHHHLSKSESTFLQVKKYISLPMTPKTYNRNREKVPEIFINKPLRLAEKSSYGSHQKNRIFKHSKQLLIRKKLFESKLSPKLECDDGIVDLQEFFVDSQLCLRSPEHILTVESEYVKIYSDCWSSDKLQRYTAAKVFDLLRKLINSL